MGGGLPIPDYSRSFHVSFRAGGAQPKAERSTVEEPSGCQHVFLAALFGIVSVIAATGSSTVLRSLALAAAARNDTLGTFRRGQSVRRFPLTVNNPG